MRWVGSVLLLGAVVIVSAGVGIVFFLLSTLWGFFFHRLRHNRVFETIELGFTMLALMAIVVSVGSLSVILGYEDSECVCR